MPRYVSLPSPHKLPAVLATLARDARNKGQSRLARERSAARNTLGLVVNDLVTSLRGR